MDEFLQVFREHEEELEVACPEFAVRIQELMQADIVASNRIGSRYSKQFSEDITMRCGKEISVEDNQNDKADGDGKDPSKKKKRARRSPVKAGGSNADKNPQGGRTSKRVVNLFDPPTLSLQERIRLQLDEKMAEDREMSQLVASMEEKILENEVLPSQAKAEAPRFIEMCGECGERHIHEERECHMCGEVHDGCCDL